MFERHVTFHVNEGAEAEFQDLFVSRYRPAMARQAGFQRVELLRSAADPQAFVMMIRFDTVEHASDWRELAEHTELKPVITRLYTASDVEVFDVVA